MERRQDASVARLPDVVLERRDDVSRGCNKDVPSVRLRRLKELSNETLNKISVVPYQDISVVRIH